MSNLIDSKLEPSSHSQLETDYEDNLASNPSVLKKPAEPVSSVVTSDQLTKSAASFASASSLDSTTSESVSITDQTVTNPQSSLTLQTLDLANLKLEYDFVFAANIYLDSQNNYFSGGAEIHLRNICQTLQKYGEKITGQISNGEGNLNQSPQNLTFTTSNYPEQTNNHQNIKILVIQQSDTDSLISKDGLDVLKIKTTNNWVFRWKLAQVLKKINTPRVHFNYIGLETFVTKKPGVIYSATFHGTCWDFPTEEFPQKYIDNSLKQKLGSKLVKWNYVREQRKALHWFDGFLSVDTSLTRFAQMFLYEKSAKIEVAYNFVDLEKFVPKNNFSSDKFTILYPRNISFARGVHLLVPIAKYLKDKQIDFVIKMVGAGFDNKQMGHYEKTLKDEITEAKLESNFDFVGRIDHDQMPELFQNCHLVIVPTYFSEGTSLSCLEAMASGKPVVVSNIGGLSDLVIHGHNGFISSPTALEIARNIEHVYRHFDQMDRITGNAYQIITQNHSLLAWQQKVIKFFGQK